MLDLRPKFQWGTHLWSYIHTITVIDYANCENSTIKAIEILKNIKNVIQCPVCVKKYEEHLNKLDSIDPSQPMVLFQWAFELHNDVNKKLNKPEITYEEAINIWCNKIC